MITFNNTHFDLLKDTSMTYNDFTNRNNNQVQGQTDNCWDGFHTKRYRNGNIYTGLFLNGKRHGNGKLV